MRCKLRAPITASTSFSVRPRIAIQGRINGSIRTRHWFLTQPSRTGGVIHQKQGRKLGTSSKPCKASIIFEYGDIGSRSTISAFALFARKSSTAMRCKLRAPKTARTSFTVRPRNAIQVRISGSIRTRHRFPTRPSRAGGVIHRRQGRKLGAAFHRLDYQDLPSRTPGIIHRKQRSRPGRMVTIAERGAVDRGSAGANLIPTRRERHSKHSEQPPRNPCRDALTSHSLGCYFQRGNGPSGYF